MRKYLVFALISLFNLTLVFGQEVPKNEDELKKKAEELFVAEKFVEAEPLFAQLLSHYPKDPNYNFKYGACLLAKDDDKEKPLKYLKFSITKGGVDPTAYYFLGRAHHLNYEFAKAVKYYSRFKTKASSSQKEKYDVERQIQMCKNGNELLTNFSEVQVLSSQEVAEKDFYRLYDLEGIGGKIISKPDEFLSKYDKKKGENSVVFLPNNAKELYYSSYGNKGEAGRDIFKVVKLGNGKWSEPVNLGESINTPYDENFAFIHPDGRTLYFSSKGHNSMGGYDLFMSTFDQSINNWTEPVNMDFAFSSADNDLLFITDANKEVAYFASNRSNEAGRMSVYKVLVERAPADVSIIQGKLIVENSDAPLKAKVTVVDKLTNETVGVYNTDEKGNYKVELSANGGVYQFNLETSEDAPIHTGIVNIPKQEEFEVLGQELRLVGEGDAQQLVIKNIFDGTVAASASNSGPKLSASMLRSKAALGVNVSAEQLALKESSDDSVEENNSLEETKAVIKDELSDNTEEPIEEETSTEENVDNVEESVADEQGTPSESNNSAAKVLEEFNDLAANYELHGNNLSENSNAALGHASQNMEQAKVSLESYETKKQAGEEEEALSLSKEIAVEDLLKSGAINKLAFKVNGEAKNFEAKQIRFNSEKENISNLIESGNTDEASNLILAFKNDLEESKAVNVVQEERSEVAKNIRENAEHLAELERKKDALSVEKSGMLEQIEALNEESEKASKGKKAQLQTRIDQLELDQKDLSFQLDETQSEIDESVKAEEALQYKLGGIDELVEVVQASSTNSSVVSNEQIAKLKTDAQALNSSEILLEVNNNNSLTELTNNIYEQRNLEAYTKLKEEANEHNNSFPSLLAKSESISDGNKKIAVERGLYEEWNATAKSIEDRIESQLGLENDNSRKEELLNLKNTTSSRIVENSQKVAEIDNTLTQAGVTDINQFVEDTNNELALAENTTETNSVEPTAVEPVVEETENEETIQSNELTSSEVVSTTENEENKLNSDFDFSSVDVSQIDENSIVPTGYSNFDFEDYEYKNNSKSNAITEIKKSLAIAGQIKDESNSVKRSAFSLGSIQEREAAFKKASELKVASEVKQIEAMNSYSALNNEEFQRNLNLIAKANSFDIEFESSNLDMANLLSEEAETYFNQAVEIRSTIDPTERLSKQEVKLQKAYDLEMLALKKQGEAIKVLKIADEEYLNKDVVAETTNISAAPNFELITDEEVLAVNDAAIAQQKAQELEQEVSELNIKLAEIQTTLDSGDEIDGRDSLLALVDELNGEISTKSNKANVFYAREKQIDAGQASENDRAVDPTYGIIKAATVSDITVNIDTVVVSEERKQELMQSAAYVEYVTAARERLRTIKAAEVDYEMAVELQQKKIDFLQTAKTNRGAASSTSDTAERDRLVKEAEVLEQNAAKIENSVDSLNSLLRVKQYLVKTQETKLATVISQLPAEEKNEILSIAATSGELDPEAIVLPEIATSGEVLATETSLVSSDLQNLSNQEVNVETIDLKEGTELVNQESDNASLAEQVSSDIEKGNFSTSDGNENGSGGVGNGVTTTATKKIEPIESIPSSGFNSSSKDINRVPKRIEATIFKKLATNESAYDRANPIPKVTDLPEGLIYKVQVGAFRNPIPQNLFKGFAPLSGEKGPNGITRYTAGYFLDEGSANGAKNEIRGFGYSDAFVVAFYNGKRVSISEARSGKFGALNSSSVSVDKEVESPSKEVSNSESNVRKEDRLFSGGGTMEDLPIEFENPEVEEVINATTIEGLYFTIQVGVYSTPVKKGKFSNLPDLNVFVIETGHIRYNVGIYKNLAEANTQKEKMKSQVPDAFIAPYYNGKRLTINEAARILNR